MTGKKEMKVTLAIWELQEMIEVLKKERTQNTHPSWNGEATCGVYPIEKCGGGYRLKKPITAGWVFLKEAGA